MYSYIIVRIIPTINTWYFVTGIDYYNNISTSIQLYIHDIVHSAFSLQHFRHYYCCNNCCCCVIAVAVVLILTRRYNAVRGHRIGSNYCVHPPPFNTHGL